MLRDITIGRYIDTSSPIHNADPAVKILTAVIYSAAVLAASDASQLIAVFIFTAVAIYISKIQFRYMLKGLKPLRWFILLSFVTVLFTGKDNPLWHWSFLCITRDSIYSSIAVSLRFIFFTAGASLLTLTTPPVALTDGLSRLMKPLRRIKVPVDDIAMIISVTLRFIPVFADESEKIIKAQRARGADLSGSPAAKVRAVIPIIVPLLISVFRHAENLALAMESRCYGRSGRMPHRTPHLGKNDAYIAVFTIIFCIFLGFLRFLH